MALAHRARFSSDHHHYYGKRQGPPLDVITSGTTPATSSILEQATSYSPYSPGGSSSSSSSMSTSDGPLNSSSAGPVDSGSLPVPSSTPVSSFVPMSLPTEPGPSPSPTSTSSTLISSSSSSLSSFYVFSTTPEQSSSSLTEQSSSSSSSTSTVATPIPATSTTVPHNSPDEASQTPSPTVKPSTITASWTPFPMSETSSSASPRTNMVTTITYLTSSGSSTWVATTTQTLVDPTGGSDRPSFASNTGAIVAVSLTVGFIVLALAILLFVLCARKRHWKTKAKRLIETEENKRRSGVRLEGEFAYATTGYHSADDSLGPSRPRSKGEDSMWLGGTGHPITGIKTYHDTPSLDGHSRPGTSSMPRGSPSICPSNSFDARPYYGFSSQPMLDGTSGEWSDGPHLHEDYNRRTANSSQSHVQISIQPVTSQSSETDLVSHSDVEDGSGMLRKGLFGRLRSSLSVPFSTPPTSILHSQPNTTVARSLPPTPDIGRRSQASSVDGSGSARIPPPAPEMTLFHSSPSHLQPPPVWIQATSPSSLLNPPHADTQMIQTAPSAGPSNPFFDPFFLSSPEQPKKARTRPPSIRALPVFSYTPPTPHQPAFDDPFDLPNPIWVQELGQQSPPISVHRDGLVDVHTGRERERMMSRSYIDAEDHRDSEEHSLRDWVDYSRPVLLRNAQATASLTTLGDGLSDEAHVAMAL